jgi:serine/threonine protein kinase
MSGTLLYMAPEIIRGEGCFSSDIYSLSVTMYEMVTGQLPIKGGSIDELVHNIQLQTPKPPEQIRSGIPKQLNNLILKGLEKDVSKRIKTIEEMLDAIRQLKSPFDLSIDVENAWRAFRGGDIKETEKLFREILQKYPDNVECYLNIAEFYNRCENYDMSIRVLKKGLIKDSKSGIVHWNLAMAYNQKKKLTEAVQMLEKALEFGLSDKMQNQGKVILNLWKKSG